VIGAPVFLREILAHTRRPRTYVFQTIFLGILVICLIPLWDSSGDEAADRGRLIFEYGGYLQIVLLALLAPAVTANAITEEKSKNTLDLLLLTGTGPFAIVLGKFISRAYVLLFLLFLTVPILFALLTLGGVSATTILMEVSVLVSFAVFGAGLGIFLSTIVPRTTTALLAGYVLLGAVLASPALLVSSGAVPSTLGGGRVSAYMSPLWHMDYVFNPSHFVAAESSPVKWWVTPLWTVGAGLSLVLFAGLLLPHARQIERYFNVRALLDAFDHFTYRLLRPGKLRKQAEAAAKDAEDAEGPGVSRPIGAANPVYWKETTVNTIGRFKHWWRTNLLVLVGLAVAYATAARLDLLSDIEFQRYVVAVLAGLIVLLSTIIAATTVSREREDGTLVLLATTPVECATYVEGKVRGIGRNIVFLVALPFVHVLIFTIAGVISPWSFLFLLLSIPIAAAASIVQGIFVSLLFPTTLRAILASVILIICEAVLPLVCCLPTFNLPLACYYMVEPATGLAAAGAATQGASFKIAMLLASVFSGSTQLGYTFVVYSLIRSGFDRYVGRAA